MEEFSIGVALLAGLVSFLSPCILPIIPGFLAYLAGTSSENTQPKRSEVFLNSLFFVLGFSVIFAALGALLNSLLESIAYDTQIWLSRIGGLIIIAFGLYLTKLLPIPWLDKKHGMQVKTKFKSRYLTSFVFGAAFAAGWTPCVGAALGAILGLAASQPGLAFWLLLAYAIGLGVPFLIIGLFTAQASKLISKLGKWLTVINIIFGILLIIIGIMVFTQTLSRLASFEILNSVLLNMQ